MSDPTTLDWACPRCERVNETRDRFCGACGTDGGLDMAAELLELRGALEVERRGRLAAEAEAKKARTKDARVKDLEQKLHEALKKVIRIESGYREKTSERDAAIGDCTVAATTPNGPWSITNKKKALRGRTSGLDLVDALIKAWRQTYAKSHAIVAEVAATSMPMNEAMARVGIALERETTDQAVGRALERAARSRP